jgi:hypothetical protein
MIIFLLDERKLDEYNPVIMDIKDVGEKCLFTFPSRYIDITSKNPLRINGSINNIKKSIKSIYVTLIKAEIIEDEAYDGVVLLHKVLGDIDNSQISKSTPDHALYSEGLISRNDNNKDVFNLNEPILNGSDIVFDLSFSNNTIIDDDNNNNNNAPGDHLYKKDIIEKYEQIIKSFKIAESRSNMYTSSVFNVIILYL